MDALTPQDATRFWLSRRGGNDLFLLYCFDDTATPDRRLRTAVHARSAHIPQLRVRIREHRFAYPSWEPCAFDESQVVVHRLDRPLWTDVEASLNRILDEGVTAERYTWRLHLLRDIRDAPGGTEPALVAVLQISHALADGRGAAAIARELLSGLGDEPSGPVPGGDTTAVAEWAEGAVRGERTEGGVPSERTEPVEPGDSVPRAELGGRAESTEACGASAELTEPGRPNDRIGPAASPVRADPAESCPAPAAGAHRASVTRGVVTTADTARRGGAVYRVRTGIRRLGRRPVSSPQPDDYSGSPPPRGAARLRYRRDGAITEGRALLGLPLGMGRTVVRGLAAARAETELRRLAAAREIPDAAPGFELTRLNHPPAPEHRRVRMLVGEDLRVPGHTVTIVALTAISLAMSRYVSARGVRAEHLGAQVSMAIAAQSRAGPRKNVPHNNYRDLGVDLAVNEPDLRRRADRIAETLAERRARATHPLQHARDRVTDTIPAPILRRDIAGYPLDLVPDRISGHTVLSSVHRGPADLSIMGGRVRFTAGFPSLGSVMHLTHGLHGLGDTVTLSIHADPQVMPDADDYAELLRSAVQEVVESLTPFRRRCDDASR